MGRVNSKMSSIPGLFALVSDGLMAFYSTRLAHGYVRFWKRFSYDVAQATIMYRLVGLTFVAVGVWMLIAEW